MVGRGRPGEDSTSGGRDNRPPKGEEEGGSKEGADKSSLLLPRLHDVFASLSLSLSLIPTAIVNELMRAERPRERQRKNERKSLWVLH